MSLPRNPGVRLYLAAIVSLILVGCNSGGTAEDGKDGADVVGNAGDSKAFRFVPVNLEPNANRPLSELAGLPTGSQTLEGVDYQIGSKLLQLGSKGSPNFPREITGIPVGDTCQAVHFLHASQGGGFTQPGPKHEADGVEIGRYVFHYDDGTEQALPLIYSENLRDWWDWDGNPPTTRARLVWTGENPNAGRYGRKIRLYWTVWENPHPEKPVATIDYVSAGAKAAPFCVAMTLEQPLK